MVPSDRTIRDECGCSSAGRASLFQSECRGFDARRPLVVPATAGRDRGWSLHHGVRFPAWALACGCGTDDSNGRCQVPDHCRPSPNLWPCGETWQPRRIQAPVSDRTCGFDSLQGYCVRKNDALWGNRQPTGFWLREFRFEPWRGSRSADSKRTLPRSTIGSCDRLWPGRFLVRIQTGQQRERPLGGVNRPRDSGLRGRRSRSMFDAMAPFQDRRHNALIAQ